jgi:hypothetical protein
MTVSKTIYEYALRLTRSQFSLPFTQRVLCLALLTVRVIRTRNAVMTSCHDENTRPLLSDEGWPWL